MVRDPESFVLPFPVRDMLAFEGTATFDLELTVSALFASSLEITGITREGAFKFDVTTGSSGASETFILGLPDLPIWVSVRQSDTDVGMNDAYVMLYLRINQTKNLLLCQGFMGDLYGINWPNQVPVAELQKRGRYDIFEGVNPAANTEFSITIPDNVWVVPRVLEARLVTDANAATRRVTLNIDDQSGILMRILSAGDHTASLGKDYHWFVGAAVIDDTTSNRQNMPLPSPVILPPATVLSSSTANRQAGDNWGRPALIGEALFSPPPNF